MNNISIISKKFKTILAQSNNELDSDDAEMIRSFILGGVPDSVIEQINEIPKSQLSRGLRQKLRGKYYTAQQSFGGLPEEIKRNLTGINNNISGDIDKAKKEIENIIAVPESLGIRSQISESFKPKALELINSISDIVMEIRTIIATESISQSNLETLKENLKSSNESIDNLQYLFTESIEVIVGEIYEAKLYEMATNLNEKFITFYEIIDNIRDRIKLITESLSVEIIEKSNPLGDQIEELKQFVIENKGKYYDLIKDWHRISRSVYRQFINEKTELSSQRKKVFDDYISGKISFQEIQELVNKMDFSGTDKLIEQMKTKLLAYGKQLRTSRERYKKIMDNPESHDKLKDATNKRVSDVYSSVKAEFNRICKKNNFNIKEMEGLFLKYIHSDNEDTKKDVIKTIEKSISNKRDSEFLISKLKDNDRNTAEALINFIINKREADEERNERAGNVRKVQFKGIEFSKDRFHKKMQTILSTHRDDLKREFIEKIIENLKYSEALRERIINKLEALILQENNIGNIRKKNEGFENHFERMSKQLKLNVDEFVRDLLNQELIQKEIPQYIEYSIAIAKTLPLINKVRSFNKNYGYEPSNPNFIYTMLDDGRFSNNTNTGLIYKAIKDLELIRDEMKEFKTIDVSPLLSSKINYSPEVKKQLSEINSHLDSLVIELNEAVSAMKNNLQLAISQFKSGK